MFTGTLLDTAFRMMMSLNADDLAEVNQAFDARKLLQQSFNSNPYPVLFKMESKWAVLNLHAPKQPLVITPCWSMAGADFDEMVAT